MRKHLFRGAVLAALLLFLLSCGGAPFTPEAWRDADMQARRKMTRSLMKQYDPVGLGWEEADVVKLLGPETSADPGFRYSLRPDADDTLVSALGASGAADVEFLVVTLDEDRVVTGWEIVKKSM